MGPDQSIGPGGLATPEAAGAPLFGLFAPWDPRAPWHPVMAAKCVFARGPHNRGCAPLVDEVSNGPSLLMHVSHCRPAKVRFRVRERFRFAANALTDDIDVLALLPAAMVGVETCLRLYDKMRGRPFFQWRLRLNLIY